MIITRPRRGARALIALLLLVGCAGVQAQSMLPESSYAQLHWRLVGPFRGGWATMAAGVPGRPDTFYFGAAGGGVWKTVNAGRSWTSVGASNALRNQALVGAEKRSSDVAARPATGVVAARRPLFAARRG